MNAMSASSIRRGLLVVSLMGAAFAAAPARADAGTEHVEISSPLFPRTSVLYPAEGASFPTTLVGEQTLAHDATLTFDTLLTSCAATHPSIVLASEGTTLTGEQLATNYNEVANCAYSVYTVKPYWIPQLVDDVDVCEAELGADWHLPTEADVNSFTTDDLTLMATTLSGTAGSSGLMGTFYFSLTIFVRGGDGSLKKADLSPGALTRVSSLGLSESAMKMHLEGGVALRCIRRTSL